MRVASVPTGLVQTPLAPPVAAEVPSRALFGNSWGHEPQAALAEFDRWATDYVAAPAENRPAMLPEGVRLATARRVAMVGLIHEDPRQAIASTVPAAVRQQLPAEIQPLLEKRVEAKGTLAQNGVLGQPGDTVKEPVYRTALLEGAQYRAFVYGRRTRQATRTQVALHGVALEGAAAISDSPIRLIEPGETVNPALVAPPICPVSGNPTGQGGSESTSAVQTGDKVQPLCHIAHAETLEKHLEADEDAASTSETEADREAAWDVAADGNPGASGVQGRPSVAWSTGTKKLLLIRVDFSDMTGAPKNGSTTVDGPYLDDLYNNTSAGISTFYSQGSYGLTTLSFSSATDMTSVLRMPQSATYYAQGNGSDAYNYELHQAAEAAASKAGWNPNNYDRVGVLFSWLGNISGSFITYGGLGEIQGKNFWANGEIDFRVCAHELGHTYGLQHCNLWQVRDGNPISPNGSSTEYGDPFGVMGGGSTNINYQFDPWQKTILHWIPDASVPVAKTSGVYRIYRFDSKSANTANTMGIKVAHDGSTDYWISNRQLFPSNSSLSNGAYILWGYNTVVQGNLLDFTTPGNNAQDAALAIGTAFTDTTANVTLKPLAKGGTSPNEYLDVQVDYSPHVKWLSSTFAADQQSGQAIVTLARTGSNTGAISVQYATSDGTATAPANYMAANGTVSWAAGDGSPKTITIPLATTPPIHSITSFNVTLSGSTGGAILDTPASAVVNIGTSGMTDSSFVSNNFANAIERMVRQPDGKLLVVGGFGARGTQYGAGFARLNADGTADTSFYSGAGANVLPVTALALQADGKVLIGGDFTTINGIKRNRLARLNADGTLDITFDPGTGADDEVRIITVQPDGQILIGGTFVNYGGTNANALARLNPDASIDSGFSQPGLTAGAALDAIVLQPSNKVLIGGAFTVSGGTKSGVTRLNADGTLDSSFATGAGTHALGSTSTPMEVFALVSQPDGDVVIGGNFTAFNGTARNNLARVNNLGALRSNFNPGANNAILCLALQPDGRIIAGGTFTNLASVNHLRFGRLNADGSEDNTFVTSTGSPTAVNDFSFQPDGSILIAKNYLSGTTTQEIDRVFAGLSGRISSVQFGAAAVSGNEGDTVKLTATRTGGTTGAISANYSTQLLTADASRITPTSGTLTWADGDGTPRTISVPLIRDATVQTVQTAAVNLGTLTGGVIVGAPAQDVITINGDSGDLQAPALTISSPADGVIVLSPNLTISGTASDASTGASGILSVKVNGVAATGGSSTGANTASWSLPLTFALGVNTITVVATDRAANPTTKTITASYYNAPAIGSQPASQTVYTGKSATLNVTLLSSGATSTSVNYQWYQGASGDTSNPIAGATSASLVTPPITSTIWYWVRITNANGTLTDSSTAVVDSAVSPTITTQPFGSTINTGQSATLSVAPGASGTAVPDLSFQWYQGTSGDISRPTTGTAATYTTSALTLPSYSFWVRLTNSAGFSTDSDSVQVAVNQAPSISEQPGSAHINPGQSVNLSVTVLSSGTSDPTLSFQWYQGVSGDKSLPVASTASNFTSPALSSDTNYWVQVSNSAGLTTNSGTASIVLNAPPAIRTQPHSVSIADQTSATLQVVASASGTDIPSLTYKWYQGAAGDTSLPLANGSQAIFVTPKLTGDTTLFWVRLTNSAGLSTDSVTAVVKITKAPRITTQPIGASIQKGQTRYALKVVAVSGNLDPTLTYKWYTGQSGDTSHPAVNDEFLSVYATEQLSVNTSFWVRVTGSDKLYTDSSTAEVRVYDAPQPNLAPMPVSGSWANPLAVSANPHGTVDDAPILSSKTLFVGVAYKNIGIATAEPFDGTVTLQPGNRVLTFKQKTKLGAGKSSTQLGQKTLTLGKLPAGTYALTLQLDPEKANAESLVTDNTYTRTFVVIDPPTPKLTAALNVHGTPSTLNGTAGMDLYWSAGSQLPMNWTVERRELAGRTWGKWAAAGTADAPLMRDNTVATGSTYEYRVTGHLGSANSAPSLPSPSITVPAVVDAQSLIDLSPSSLTTAMTPGATADAPLTNAGNVLASLTVTNRGNSPSSATGFNVDLSVDGRPILSARATAAIPANPGTLLLPDLNLGRLTPGTHTVTAQVDPALEVDELERSNNLLTTTITVSAVMPELDGLKDATRENALPLVIAAQPNAASSTAIRKIDHAYFSVSVANDGFSLLSTQSFNLGLYLDGELVATKQITAGADSAWTIQDFDLGLLKVGNHSVAVRIDDSDDVAEGTEADNLLSKQFSVTRK